MIACGLGPAPRGVPPWLWAAVHDLYGARERIDAEALDAGQQAQDPEADRYEWCRQAAELLNARREAAGNARVRRTGNWPPVQSAANPSDTPSV